MSDPSDAVNPTGETNPGPPAPQPGSADSTGRPSRGYYLASGEDVVLEFDAPNLQIFDCEAICDPAELAKITRPPQS